MKKLLATVLGLSLFMTQMMPVFAEISRDDVIAAAVGNRSMDKLCKNLSELEKDENDEYIFHISGTDTTVLQDITNNFRVYGILVSSKKQAEEYNGEGLVEYFSENIITTGRERYYTFEEDGCYVLSVYDEVAIAGEPDEGRYYTCYKSKKDNFEETLDNAISAANDYGVSEVYDAYPVSFNCHRIYKDGGGRTDYIGCIYFNTDKGEIVVPFYTNGHIQGIVDLLKVYSVEEMLDCVADLLSTSYTVTEEIADENGDRIETIIRETVEENLDEEEPKQEQIADETPVDDEEEKVVEDEEEPIIEEDVQDEEEVAPKDEEPEVIEDEPDVMPEKDWVDVLLHGTAIAFEDQQPVIRGDRVLVPFRTIFAALGADIVWDDETKTVTATRDGITASLQIGSKQLVKNGEAVELDVPAQLVNDRTLVPIRAISESFGNTVTWDGENKVVEIK